MSSIFSLPESDQSRTRKEGPLELYLWPNDPEHTTITTDAGLPEYQVFTKEGQLFGSGRVSSFDKLVDGADGGIAAWVCSFGLCILRATQSLRRRPASGSNILEELGVSTALRLPTCNSSVLHLSGRCTSARFLVQAKPLLHIVCFPAHIRSTGVGNEFYL
jgi:hypothetical protein